MSSRVEAPALKMPAIRRETTNMKTILKTLIQTAGLAALLAAANAFAQADVGLINQMSGDVSYTSGAGKAQAKAYMKIREGDRFTLPAGAQMRVVYFKNGRQESYSGPASFTAG